MNHKYPPDPLVTQPFNFFGGFFPCPSELPFHFEEYQKDAKYELSRTLEFYQPFRCNYLNRV